MPDPTIPEMVERVARKMCAEPDALIHVGMPIPNWLPRGYHYAPRPADTFPAWQLKIQDAIDAIEAMREPTEAMVDAAKGDTQGAPSWADWFSPWVMRTISGKGISGSWFVWGWRRAIDAALGK